MGLIVTAGSRLVYDFPDQVVADLSVGNGALVVDSFGEGQATADTAAFDTVDGMLFAAVGRGAISDFGSAVVSDNAGNTLALQGSSHNYGSEWPNSGTACFLKANATGKTGCVVSDSKPTNSDECTVLAINILGATTVEDSSFVYRPSGPTNAGTDITVTKHSVLVSVWSGNDSVGEDDPDPGAGWTRQLFTNLLNGNHVQMAMATKIVDAGTYGITWTPNRSQGGQVYLFGLN